MSVSKIEHMSDQWIQASEISSYVYCRRSWWLKRKHGAISQNVRELQGGTKHHKAHSKVVLQAIWVRRFAYLFLFIFVAFMTFQLLMSSVN